MGSNRRDGGATLPGPAPDTARMGRERRARLQGLMAERGIGALLALGSGGASYVAGGCAPVGDPSHRLVTGTGALLLAGEDHPHVFTARPEWCPPDVPSGHRHGPLHPWSPGGVEELVRALCDAAGGRLDGALVVDEMPSALWFHLGDGLGRCSPGTEVADATELLASARVVKTPDELLCIERAQRINELAMADVAEVLRPGVRQSELTGHFLRRCFELGATGNCVDPIWQVVPPALADGPFTTTGGLAFPLVSTDRILRRGDVLWIDAGVEYEGYVSDFGTTWIVGDGRPTPRQEDQFRRWNEVVAAVLEAIRPGATGGELTRAATRANGGAPPWLPHLYLGHGIGASSAEMPILGSDLGPAFDESVVLEEGMVFVLEPAVWDDGAGGYRYEEVLAVTGDGFRRLSSYPYHPFEGRPR